MTAAPEPADRTHRIVVVTGGGTGIGREITRAFVEHGDHVVICGRTMQSLRDVQQELGDRVQVEVCDVGVESDVASLVDRLVAEHDRIDVLVNNAGVYGPIGPAWENAPAEWLQALQINLFGVFAMTHHVAKVMVRQGGGAIVNLSGGGATSSKPRYSAYAAAKSGVVRFTEVVADELRDHGVRVNAIAPGFIVTRFHDETLAAGDAAGPDLAATKKKLANGGDDPRQAAELAVFLAGPDADGITGKLFSAIWDDWRSPELRDRLRASRDLYTLRRIDDVMFREVEKR